VIHKGADSISLIGVESWGLKPFHCYGNLPEAMKGVDKQSFKILLSHIPSHWVVEVKGETDIDLTLSGHTHAAQFGVTIGTWHWSPIVFKYPHYMGLYQWGTQYLYVNPGLGYLGFPGRIGIQPEITVFTLNRIGLSQVVPGQIPTESNVVTNPQ
jgi:predicted MPP superfamily phosphohydrolase